MAGVMTAAPEVQQQQLKMTTHAVAARNLATMLENAPSRATTLASIVVNQVTCPASVPSPRNPVEMIVHAENAMKSVISLVTARRVVPVEEIEHVTNVVRLAISHAIVPLLPLVLQLVVLVAA